MATRDSQLAAALLAQIIARPGVRPRDLRVLDGRQIPRPTLSRYLRELVREGKVRSDGAGPSMRYYATDFDAYFAIPVARRPAATYREDRGTHLLPSFAGTDLARLKAAASPGGATAEERARGVREQLMIELSYASSAFEGNTYTLIETQALIEYGEQAHGKPVADARMILNHRDAIRYLLDNVGAVSIDWPTVRDVHSLLSDGLLADPADSGRVRQRAVAIGNSTYRPLDNEYQLREALDALLRTINDTPDPYSRSLRLMVGFAYLQPFMDCNKRTGRVLANLPLLQAALPPLSFVTVDKAGYLSGLLGYYELGEGARIKAVFRDGYLSSASTYRDLVEAPGRPAEEAAAELKYRSFLRQRLRDIVQRALEASAPLPDTIPEHDRRLVAQILARQLATMHPGRAAVIGVSAQDVERYLAARPASV